MAHADVAREVAGRLNLAESRIDAALAAVAELAAALPPAGGRLGLAAGAGQPVLAETGAALALLVESRGRLAGAHRRLAAVARALRLSDPAIGPLDKPGEDEPRPGGAVTPLRRPAA